MVALSKMGKAKRTKSPECQHTRAYRGRRFSDQRLLRTVMSNTQFQMVTLKVIFSPLLCSRNEKQNIHTWSEERERGNLAEINSNQNFQDGNENLKKVFICCSSPQCHCSGPSRCYSNVRVTTVHISLGSKLFSSTDPSSFSEYSAFPQES